MAVPLTGNRWLHSAEDTYGAMTPPPCPCGHQIHSQDSTSSHASRSEPRVAMSSSPRMSSAASSAKGLDKQLGTDGCVELGAGTGDRGCSMDMLEEVTHVHSQIPRQDANLSQSRSRRHHSTESDMITTANPTHRPPARPRHLGDTSSSMTKPAPAACVPSASASCPSPRHAPPQIGDYPPTAWGERMRREEERERRNPRGKRGWRNWLKVIRRHGKFVGPGMVSSVAYFDPGNWTVDLSAGASYGYKLLFVILASGLAAAVLQVMALRLGITTGTSLSRQIRLLFLRWRERFEDEDAAAAGEGARRVDDGDAEQCPFEASGEISDEAGNTITASTRSPRPRKFFRRTRKRDKLARTGIMAGLYTLWVLSEIAIISTDLAELLGSAIAINLLIPKIPLYAGVLITASDVFLVLIFLQNKEGGRKGMMLFELLICSLVLCVFASFIILLVQIKPDWADAFHGYLPSKTLFQPGALYTSIGIIGATIMPHGLYLGSELATIDRLDMAPRPPLELRTGQESRGRRFIEKFNPLGRLFYKGRPARPAQDVAFSPSRQQGIPLTGLELGPEEVAPRKRDVLEDAATTEDLDDEPEEEGEDDSKLTAVERLIISERTRYEAEMKVFDRIKHVGLHIAHATVDTTFSLIGFAITINSSILILASAAFFYGDVSEEIRAAAVGADLFSAHDLIESQLSSAAAFIFALALLCAGQSSSITATLAGQIVSEGFLEWRTSPLVRRMITRMIGIVPSVAVAIAVGRSGISTMLVASQVVLSIVLPTVILPLVYLCSRPEVMTVENGKIPGKPPAPIEQQATSEDSAVEEAEDPAAGRRSFVTWWPLTWLGYLIFSVVCVANAYVLVQLIMGNE